jgi:hypothetical protein
MRPVLALVLTACMAAISNAAPVASGLQSGKSKSKPSQKGVCSLFVA